MGLKLNDFSSPHKIRSFRCLQTETPDFVWTRKIILSRFLGVATDFKVDSFVQKTVKIREGMVTVASSVTIWCSQDKLVTRCPAASTDCQRSWPWPASSSFLIALNAPLRRPSLCTLSPGPSPAVARSLPFRCGSAEVGMRATCRIRVRLRPTLRRRCRKSPPLRIRR